jgi:hypothetical protein
MMIYLKMHLMNLHPPLGGRAPSRREGVSKLIILKFLK